MASEQGRLSLDAAGSRWNWLELIARYEFGARLVKWTVNRRWRDRFLLLGMCWLLVGCQFSFDQMVQDRWEFSAGYPSQWTSPNAEVVPVTHGIALIPREEPAVLLSGPLSLDLRRYRRVRISLITESPSEGRLGLVVEATGGSQRVSFSFKTHGGRLETFDLDLSGLPSGILKEAILVPSLIPQPVGVGSVRFDAVPPLVPWLDELLSPKPGVNLALRGYSINFVDAPSIHGRSLWQWLFPVVLGLAIAVFGFQGTAKWQATIRASAMQGLVIMWGLGVCFLVYHQSIALSVDVKRFGGLSREEAYQRMDAGPLWRDMRAVSSFATPNDSIELVLHVEGVMVSFLRYRAAYHLAPVPVLREGATLRLHYFADVHAPCATVEPRLVLLEESKRVCLFRVHAT